MVARTAYTQLDHSPLLLAGTVLWAWPLAYLAPPLLLFAGEGRRRSVLARGLRWRSLMCRCCASIAARSLCAPLLPARCGGLSWRDARFRAPLLARRGRRVEGKGAMAEPALGRVETPSGKGRGDENFPVGSWLIRRDLRPHVHAFYRFARAADDVADNPALAARRQGAPARPHGRGARRRARRSDAPAARAMRASLAETGVTAQHCHDVLTAFRLDATKLRYRDWDDLMEYCRYSAAPVGRQLLDLHGEGRQSLDAVRCAVQRAPGAQSSCRIAATIIARSTASTCRGTTRRLRRARRGSGRAARQPRAPRRDRSGSRRHRSAHRTGPLSAAGGEEPGPAPRMRRHRRARRGASRAAFVAAIRSPRA